MATAYTWKVNTLYTVDAPEPGFVSNVLWTVSGVDGPYSASADGATSFSDSDNEFIPYDELTEEAVISWVRSALGPDSVANYEANVQGQINTMASPPVPPREAPLPWKGAGPGQLLARGAVPGAGAGDLRRRSPPPRT